jgi:hypothetical protein
MAQVPLTLDSLIKIQNRLVRLITLYGSTFYASKTTPIYRSVYNPVAVYTAKPGDAIGIFYAKIYYNGVNYFSYLDNNKRAYYTEAGDNVIQLGPLISQGIEPLPTPGEVNRQREAEANKPEGFGEGVYRLLKSAIVGAMVVGVVYAYKSSDNKKA